uniref:hypothetical protein n=1 Tax=Microbulbifer hainanensis TaxID=2735675 RepID=UPI0018670B4B
MAPSERYHARKTCTTCPYCGVGCGVTATRALDGDNEQISVDGDTSHPANSGRLCVKGSALADTLGEA